MAILKLSLSLILFVLHGMPFLSYSKNCDDNKEENLLFQGINSYRHSLNLPNFTENSNAACLADKIADQLKNQPCENALDYRSTPGTKRNFTNFDKLLNKCHINVNTTVDGAILPVCVHKLNQTVVLSNYRNSQYAKYLNYTNHTGAGIGSDHDWIVVVLSTNRSTGSFSGAAFLAPNIRIANYMVALLLGLLLVSVS